MSQLHPVNSLSEEAIFTDSGNDGTRELTRALVRGDEVAWREFHQQFHLRLRAYLRACWYGPEEVLDDLTQETFLRAVKYARIFKDESALWSWLTVLARSSVADAGRKRSRWRALLDRFSGEPSPLPILPGKDFAAALNLLPAEAARLIGLKYEDELSVRQIALKLALSEKAVEGRLTRARLLLRKELDRQP